MITLTGWTWEYVDAHMTFPRLRAMTARWRELPPAAMQLARIAAALGLKTQPAQAETPETFVNKAQSLGMPVVQGRPDDPLLAFLDLPMKTPTP